ncbi:hypothetical protein So717_07100 [Roseobacter cerasinus]|uniref:N-acetyltransferase domain-containing protein n=1 Tax=Roseobacter cerasinus TaxID=2602289 RepID=A0A640VMF0_9RHOB|nr:GNAT family N-acetyltransferase [Roseobacter cerasinus]GFE48957.1 hypothetical protein So717_07100 [Roseobacter cerasinus]
MIRWAKPEDAEALAQVFYAAVHEGPSLYTAAQRASWLPHPPEGQAWAERLAPLQVAVAEVSTEIVGFMGLGTDGYVDFAFVHPAHQGTGVFRRLSGHIEAQARAAAEPRLWTHASLMAQPAFQAMGFSIIHHETVQRAGESLQRAKMEKTLR